MPNYKLTYFNGKGRAEVCRWVFAVARQEYEDERLEREQWAKIKPDTPFGQLPMLTVDGVKIAQSNAMARLLAKRFGISGKTDMDQARVDMIVDSVDDMKRPLLTIMFQTPDEAKKAELKKVYFEETLPNNLSKFEKLVNGSSGFFVGNEITLADIAFAVAVQSLDSIAWDKLPNLKALTEKVAKNPGIAAWIAKRPQTQF